MIKAVLIVVCLISFYIAWSMINYAKQVRENERYNNRVTQCSEEKKCKPKSSTEASEDQVSNKRKYKNAKKKAIESKVKKNARRNKKKV
tara:strand:- start:285 stop:551 length:267 start_codon:yes stop_codon:yes gene_type:complete